MKKTVGYLMILSFGFMACSKDVSDAVTPGVETSSMEDIVVPEGFDWNLKQDVEIEVKGANVDFNGKRIMEVINPEGQVVYKKAVKMNNDQVLKFALSRADEYVVVKYGTIEKSVQLQNGHGVFDFVTPVDMSEWQPSSR